MTTTDPEAEARARARAHELVQETTPRTMCGSLHGTICDAVTDALLTHERDLAAAVRERDEALTALTNVQRICSPPPVPPGTPAHLVPNFEKITTVVAALARAALAHPGTTAPVPKAEPHVCKCANDPCPVCGGGPSGEWHEGSEVKCDDCGTMLVVDGAQECLGRSWFSLASNPCPDCKGKGYLTLDGEVIDDEPCAKCDGDGWRELTIEEARKVAGLGGTTDVLKETTCK